MITIREAQVEAMAGLMRQRFIQQAHSELVRLWPEATERIPDLLLRFKFELRHR